MKQVIPLATGNRAGRLKEVLSGSGSGRGPCPSLPEGWGPKAGPHGARRHRQSRGGAPCRVGWEILG